MKHKLNITVLFTLLIVGITVSSTAEILSFPVFRIDVASEWTYTVEQNTAASDTHGELVSIYRPDGLGVMKVQSLVAPHNVSKDRLRNLTNVETSTVLIWKDWGDFSGYQHNYVENGSFFKQWWLLNERSILFITYESDADASQIEIEEIDKLVKSIHLNL